MMSSPIVHVERIRCSLETMSAYIAKTANLVHWIHFFSRVISTEENVCCFETPIGQSRTSVIQQPSSRPDIFHFDIVSVFLSSSKTEKALIELKIVDTGTSDIQLCITPPANAPLGLREKLDVHVREELSQLKLILEEESHA